jgi:hypothetical protein
MSARSPMWSTILDSNMRGSSVLVERLNVAAGRDFPCVVFSRRECDLDLPRIGANHVETTPSSESHHIRNASPACLKALRRRSKTCVARTRRAKTCRSKRNARERTRSARLSE